MDTLFSNHPKGDGSISCRMLEFVIHTYLKDHANQNEAAKNLQSAYLYKRKTSSVRYFDPQARGAKITVTDPKRNHTITSSQCQINFFKWAADHHLFEFVKQNRALIAREMSRHNRSKRQHRIDTGRLKLKGKEKRNCREDTKVKSFDSRLRHMNEWTMQKNPIQSPPLKKAPKELDDSHQLQGKKLSPPSGEDVFAIMGRVII